MSAKKERMIELDKGDIKKEAINESEDVLVPFRDSHYLYTSDEKYDYLVGKSEKGIKMILQFSRDKEKNERALEGIKTFFSWL